MIQVKAFGLECITGDIFIGEKFLDIGLGNDFLDMTSKTKATKAKLYKQYYISLKSFCTAKKKNQLYEKATCGMGENIFKPCI